MQSLIIDSEAHSVFLLVPEKKSYVESTELAADLSLGASIFRPRDPSDPCAEWIELVRKHFEVELNWTELLLKGQGRPADSLPLEVDAHLDAVGDPDEGNAAVHPVFLTVESHRPFNLS